MVHNGGSRVAHAARTPHHHALSCGSVTLKNKHSTHTGTFSCGCPNGYWVLLEEEEEEERERRRRRRRKRERELY